MGSGKSTIGPILANTLGFEFVDLDKFVEQKAAKKIREIFAIDGEQAFRALEQASLSRSPDARNAWCRLEAGPLRMRRIFD